ncbi:MAG: NADH-quinone oxidoreductase subunit L, partial [Pseudomonadota bacterium]|nr:NADH-quinone oxidoreductase subunit L [Pseudomonadota bacterium]
IPPFAGFFSKDAIIEAASLSTIPGAGFAHFAVLAGVFVTALYTFRMLFMTFHGKERMDHHTREHLHESPWVVTLPLVLLAIPSVLAGFMFIRPMLFGSFFGSSIYIAPANNVLAQMGSHFEGIGPFILEGVSAPPFWIALAGILTAWYLYMVNTRLPEVIRQKSGWIYTVLDHKYGFDEFNDWFFAGGARRFGRGLWKFGDVTVIDGFFVNGAARVVALCSRVMRLVQSGYIYHYAFAMIIGVFALISWFVHG